MQTQKCTLSYKELPCINLGLSCRITRDGNDHSLVSGKWKGMTDPFTACLKAKEPHKILNLLLSPFPYHLTASTIYMHHVLKDHMGRMKSICICTAPLLRQLHRQQKVISGH